MNTAQVVCRVLTRAIPEATAKPWMASRTIFVMSETSKRSSVDSVNDVLKIFMFALSPRAIHQRFPTATAAAQTGLVNGNVTWKSTFGATADPTNAVERVLVQYRTTGNDTHGPAGVVEEKVGHTHGAEEHRLSGVRHVGGKEPGLGGAARQEGRLQGTIIEIVSLLIVEVVSVQGDH